MSIYTGVTNFQNSPVFGPPCMFNVYYASVNVVDDGIVPPRTNVAVKSTIESIRFDEANVLAAIHKVKPNLSAEPDDLPPLLFKQLRYSLVRPLALLYNQLFFC